ncbi:hypothetical protein [Nocardia sp. CC227C]|uniref:hypothetical protein n=1 Tax=Nocardia sp. CC227C TaxID=3044562 RepID=UPI00278C52AC|nr:hypothetical protein [Nocardia sp. CC227C]
MPPREPEYEAVTSITGHAVDDLRSLGFETLPPDGVPTYWRDPVGGAWVKEIGRIYVWDSGHLEVQPYCDLTERDMGALFGNCWQVWATRPRQRAHKDWYRGRTKMRGGYYECVIVVQGLDRADPLVRSFRQPRSKQGMQTAAFQRRLDRGRTYGINFDQAV